MRARIYPIWGKSPIRGLLLGDAADDAGRDPSNVTGHIPDWRAVSRRCTRAEGKHPLEPALVQRIAHDNCERLVPLQIGRSLAMRATRPAAGPAHASLQLVDANRDTPLPGGLLLGRSDPADPLVAGQRREVRPELPDRAVSADGFAEVGREQMHRAARESGSCHA